METGQGNPIGGKDSQEQEKDSEVHLFPLLGVPPKHQVNSHNLYTKDLVQTQAGPVLKA